MLLLGNQVEKANNDVDFKFYTSQCLMSNILAHGIGLIYEKKHRVHDSAKVDTNWIHLDTVEKIFSTFEKMVLCVI